MLTILLSTAAALASAQDFGQDFGYADTLTTSRVSVVKEKMRNTTQTGMARLDASKLMRGAVGFGTPDIIRTLQTLPGVSAGNELMGGMYVHGGDGTDNLFLLDGVPLYNISHFGGLFSAFNADVTRGLDFYKSGFPARYGGRLSSVVDVDTREGDFNAYHGTASLGLIDGRVQFEGPIVKDRTSFNIAYRRSWMDMMIWLAKTINGGPDGADAMYFMHDFNAGITHRFSKDNTLRVNFFTGKDDMDLGLAQSSSSMDLDVIWGNLVGSATWEMKVSPALRTRLVGYYTQSHSDTGYAISMTGNTMDDTVNSKIGDAGIRYGVDWFPNSDHHVRAGLDLDAKIYRYKGQADPSDPDSVAPTVDMDSAEGSAYLEDEFFIAHNFTLNAGLRYALYANGKAWHSLEPRMAMKWAPSWFMDVKFSYSLMSQGDHLVASTYIDLPSNTWMPSTDKIRPVLSDQISGGFYFKPATGVNINIEGWYRNMEHMLLYSGPNAMFPPVKDWENSFTEGKGRSYGLEAEASWDAEKFSASAYYTLSWSQRLFPETYPFWFWDHNDNRHKINLVGSYKPFKWMEINANWNYHTGNRISFPSNVLPDGTMVYDEPYNLPLPSYHRLDLGIQFTHAMKKGQSLNTSVNVYNAYNNKNAFFAYVTTDEDGNLRGTAYSVIPVFPSLSLTYKF